MSAWQEYVDNQLVATGEITHGAIVGLNGALWAASPGFTLGNGEADALIAAFNDSTNIRANGFQLKGIKYVTLKAEGRSIYGKHGTTGCATARTGQAVIIGLYDEAQKAGNAANAVEKLADYLIQQGY